MNQPIRIGTRESQLAVWQADKVKSLLAAQGFEAELVFIKSEGDIDLVTPLYEVGVLGIFTKTLDIALLQNRIDIAVHSYKDVPTQYAKGLHIAAILPRANPYDLLVCKNEETATLIHQTVVGASQNDLQELPSIATGSIRRKAQWLHRYPHYQVENLRGNVNLRLEKLHRSNWHGAIFAAAGLERLGFEAEQTGPQITLDWMLPAPAQGAIAVACRNGDEQMLAACASFNDLDTQICTQAERDFLRILEGGCSTPIGAYAKMMGDEIHFTGNITATDGSEQIAVLLTEKIENAHLLAAKAAAEIMAKGADRLL